MKSIFDYLLYSETPEMLNFKYGYLTAVAMVLVLTLGVLFLRHVFKYPKRSRGIEIRGPKGIIFISPSAISDLVKSVGEDYDLIEISKVFLLEDKKNSFLELHIALDNDKESIFPSMAEEIQTNILGTLKNRFGIESVSKINMRVKKIESRKNRF